MSRMSKVWWIFSNKMIRQVSDQKRRVETFFGCSTFPAAFIKRGDNFLSIQAGGMSFCSEWNIIQTRIEVLNRHVAWGPFEGADENDGAPRYQARWTLACGTNEQEKEREEERKREREGKQKPQGEQRKRIQAKAYYTRGGPGGPPVF